MLHDTDGFLILTGYLEPTCRPGTNPLSSAQRSVFAEFGYSCTGAGACDEGFLTLAELGSKATPRDVLPGWRCAGVLMRGAWRAAALEAAQASATTRRGCIAAMVCWAVRWLCPALWLMSLLSSRFRSLLVSMCR